MIEFESVSKTFRDGTTAVDNLSLVVPSGKITVIVGPSGCGKTTTLRMVNRMLEPSKGKVTWDGKPIKSRRKTTLRRQMGYVIQSGGLFPHRTVLENIGTVPELLRWDKQKTRKRAIELLGSVGLDRKLGDRYPAQLSGGQQQRVGVARALAADPLVLLMDEPFSAVDPVVRAELHEFFLGLQRELSKTIIMITHDIDEAIKLGDQVAILRVGGKLAQLGTPQQVLDEPADAFVEGFVGKDRGYRSLSFQPAAGLGLGSVQVVRDASYAGAEGPVLVVDAEALPVGWADPSRPGSVMALGATFDPERDSLRTALDAALTSPVGLAVAVSGQPRRYAGVVDADMILAQVTQTRAQIAESIAIRAEDPGPTTDPASRTDPDAGPAGAGAAGAATVAAAGSADEHDPEGPNDPQRGGGPEDPAPDSDDQWQQESPTPYAAEDDPEATSVRPAFSWDDEDPDATRVAVPLPDSPTPESPTPESETSEWAAPESPASESSTWQSPPVDDEAGEPYRPDEQAYGEQSYGAEAPPTGDETVETAYDAQLTRDDVLGPQEWQTQTAELQWADESPAADRSQVDPWAADPSTADQPGGDPPSAESAAPERPADTDPDREPPR